MKYVHLVAILAVIQFIVFSMLVGRARMRYGVKAPATSGHELFERAYRVQMNTLEQLIAFLPALLIAAFYWPSQIVAGIGAVYLLGRIIYRQAYVKDPQSRGPGFMLTMVPTLVLLLMGLYGVIVRAAT